MVLTRIFVKVSVVCLLIVVLVAGIRKGITAVFANPQVPTATTHYVCECAAEADADCVNGSDAHVETSPAAPWRTFEKARNQFSTLAAGDAILFCQGGTFAADNANDRWVNGNCTAAAPCTVADYTPPWATGDEARPIIWRTAVANGFALEDGGNAEQEEGYVFRNLDMRCVGCDSNGFFLYNDIDDVLIENVSLDNFTIGVHAAGSNPCNGADPDCNGENERLMVRNATIINNTRQGFLGGSNGLLIEDSYFENNGNGTIFDHNIYISHADDMVIRRNELYRSSLNNSGNCGGTSLVGHGVMHNLLIENNWVREDIGKAEQGCWGIAIDSGYDSAEQFTNIIIRNNRVENVGNLAIGVSSCIDCVIENNVVVHEQPYGVTGIAVPDRPAGAGDATTTNVSVRNNSLSISSSGTAISVKDQGNSHQIVSNAIHYNGSSNNWRCLRAPLPAADYEAIDYNVCGFSNGSWAEGFATLTDWQTQGWGIHSQAADPGFVSNTNLMAASEAAAIVDAGDPSLSAPTSINSILRDGMPDAGAYELHSALTPQAYLPMIVVE